MPRMCVLFLLVWNCGSDIWNTLCLNQITSLWVIIQSCWKRMLCVLFLRVYVCVNVRKSHRKEMETKRANTVWWMHRYGYTQSYVCVKIIMEREREWEGERSLRGSVCDAITASVESGGLQSGSCTCSKFTRVFFFDCSFFYYLLLTLFCLI